MVLGNLHHFDEAAELHRRALGIREKAGSAKSEVCQSLDNLGWVLGHQGDYAGAEEAYRRSLATGERAWGVDSPKLVEVLTSLGAVLHLRRDYAEAETVERRRLAIVEASVGEESPQLGECLEDLRETLVSKGDFAAANPVARRALELRETRAGSAASCRGAGQGTSSVRPGALE